MGLPVDHRHLEHLADRVLAAQDTVPLLTRDEDGQRRYSTTELLATERRAMILDRHPNYILAAFMASGT